MPKPVTTNERIAKGIFEVLRNDNIGLEEIVNKVPKGFWDKVRDHMGEDSPDKGTISARWNRPSSGPHIRKLLTLWLTARCSVAEMPPLSRGPASPDSTCDPHVIEPSADIEADPPEDLDPSMVVDLNAEDLISMGVMTEPVDAFDTCDLETTDSVDLYGRDVTSMVDTIDIDTETWPVAPSVVADESIVVEKELEHRLTERFRRIAEELEARLTIRLQSLVQTTVQEAATSRSIDRERPDQEECPSVPSARKKGGSRTVSLRVRIDANLFELFDAECRLRYHGNVTQAMNAILWKHYDKPRLSFESPPDDSLKPVARE